jgi:hypothetical protein
MVAEQQTEFELKIKPSGLTEKLALFMLVLATTLIQAVPLLTLQTPVGGATRLLHWRNATKPEHTHSSRFPICVPDFNRAGNSCCHELSTSPKSVKKQRSLLRNIIMADRQRLSP